MWNIIEYYDILSPNSQSCATTAAVAQKLILPAVRSQCKRNQKVHL